MKTFLDMMRRLASVATTGTLLVALGMVASIASFLPMRSYARILGQSGEAQTDALAAPDEPSAPLAVSLAPNPATVVANGTQLFTATVTTGGGSVITNTNVTWTVNPMAGAIVATGTLTAVLKVTTATGAYSNAITASHPSGSASANVNVTPGPLASISINPPAVDLVVDTTQSFVATGRDTFGNVINGLSVGWSIAPGVGSIASSGPTTMTFRSGTTPGTYPGAIRATNGSVIGQANISLRPGPVGSVMIAPAAVTMGINTTQVFTAGVFDKFGNPRPELGVTWLTPSFNGNPAGAIENSSDTSASFRAGTRAGTFVGGVQASNSPGLGSATVVIRPDPPANVQVSANPSAITTDGVSGSAIIATVTDQYGNPIGAGLPVTLSVQCAGSCDLSSGFGVTNNQSQVSAVLRSAYTSPTQTLASTIRVTASINGGAASGSVDVAGSFVPYRSLLPVSNNAWLPGNHTVCTAAWIGPPTTLSQPADNTFNIYRFTASTVSYTVVINDYATTGQLLLYRITADTCATNGTMSVSFSRATPVTGSSFQITFANAFILGQQYLLAVNTTGALTNQPYTMTIQP